MLIQVYLNSPMLESDWRSRSEGSEISMKESEDDYNKVPLNTAAAMVK